MPFGSAARHREQVLEIIARYPVSNPRVLGRLHAGDDVESSVGPEIVSYMAIWMLIRSAFG